MRNDEPQQPIDPTLNYRPEDVTITDPVGEPLPEDHPAVQQPQVGRPMSKGDLTRPENAELSAALAGGQTRRRDIRQQVWGEEQAAAPAAAAPAPNRPQTAPQAAQPAAPQAPAAPAPTSPEPNPAP